MEIIYSLKEAVYLRGTEKQQKQFEVTGRLSTDALNSIIRSFQEEFETVYEEGRGKHKQIVLSDKRPRPIKLDKRKGTVGKKTKFANELDLLVLKALRSNENSIEGSIGNTMLEMNMANEKLCKYKQPNRLDNYLKELEENNVATDKDILTHVLDKEHDVLTTALISSLERLRKKRFIKWSKYPVGATKSFNPKYGKYTKKPTVDENGQPIGQHEYDYITLTHEQATELDQIERNLKAKHDITAFQIINYPYSQAVREYKKALTNEYNRLGIAFYFDSFSIRLVAQEDEVDHALKDNEWMIEENYINKYFEYTIEKAQKRQDNFIDEYGFGSPSKPIDNKMAKGIYVNEYRTTMKHSVLPETLFKAED